MLAMLCLSSNYVIAQQNPIRHMDVFMRADFKTELSVNNGDTTYISINTVVPQVFIDLSDTTDINQVKIKLGTNQGGNDIVEKTYSYSAANGELPDGTTYNRTGNFIFITLNELNQVATYYAEASLVKNNENTQPVFFSGQ